MVEYWKRGHRVPQLQYKWGHWRQYATRSIFARCEVKSFCTASGQLRVASQRQRNEWGPQGTNGRRVIITVAEEPPSTFPNSPLSNLLSLVGTHFRCNVFSDLKRKMDSLLRFQLVAEFEVFQNVFDGFIQSLTTCKPELAQQGPSL